MKEASSFSYHFLLKCFAKAVIWCKLQGLSVCSQAQLCWVLLNAQATQWAASSGRGMSPPWQGVMWLLSWGGDGNGSLFLVTQHPGWSLGSPTTEGDILLHMVICCLPAGRLRHHLGSQREGEYWPGQGELLCWGEADSTDLRLLGHPAAPWSGLAWMPIIQSSNHFLCVLQVVTDRAGREVTVLSWG